MKTVARREIVWRNLFFFAATTLLGLIGVPIYIYHAGISLSEVLLFLFYVLATGMSITLGYHRLFAHVAFKASKLVQFLALFFGAAAFEQSALKWAAQHREHHRYADTERDPYNIKRGFFYAHIGWLIFWKHRTPYENVKDLLKNKMVRHQHRYYHTWAILSGIVIPCAIGFLTGHLLGAFLISVCFRLTFVYHVTFCINSVCHTFGKPTYDIHSTARDHWFSALLTFGEGYHNYHHCFPGDYRNGVRWYQWDPTKWLIAILCRLRLASDVRKVSNFQILAARLSAERELLCEKLCARYTGSRLESLNTWLKVYYENLTACLLHWEESSREHRKALGRRIADRSDALLSETKCRIREARAQFQAARRQWRSLGLRLTCS